MTLSLSPEEALLARAALPPGAPSSKAPWVPAALRWDQALGLASWHRLGPLLWRYLTSAEAPVAPHDVLEGLRQETRETTVRNLNLQAQLEIVLAALAQEGIPVMLLKGAALLESVYPQVGLRPMNDLDLLVPRTSIQRAQRSLAALGYRAFGDKLGRDDELRLAECQHHYPLVDRTGAVWVELHHHVIIAGPAFDIGGYWERALPGAGKVPHLLPAPEDLLLHVAVHFAIDRIAAGRCGLGQLADLAWIANRWPIDWADVSKRAVSYGVAERLFLALLAADRLVGGVSPPQVISALQPPSYDPALGDRFLRHLVLDPLVLPDLRRLEGRPRLLLRRDDLGVYVTLDEAAAPSLACLHARRARSVGLRLIRSAARWRDLRGYVRARRWARSLSS